MTECHVGLEIRTQVTEYVIDRISALRTQSQADDLSSSRPQNSPYQNISTLRANTMKFLPNFFHRAQLTHIFLCFPDPHFKARKHKARIVSSTLCAEYAYVLREGGLVCTITDVEELAGWMARRFAAFGQEILEGEESTTEKVVGEGETSGLFERVEIPEEGKEDDWPDQNLGNLIKCMRIETEEGKKVSRNGGRKFVSIWRRKADPDWA